MYFYHYEAYLVSVAPILTIRCPISIMLYALEPSYLLLGHGKKIKVSSMYYCARPSMPAKKGLSVIFKKRARHGDITVFLPFFAFFLFFLFIITFLNASLCSQMIYP